ncbi:MULTISPECIES: hypothetical protein [Trichocoleus]|uniref:DUF2642 domain-containing protein n=1 Tax=Trichocoleus desertorum GB2-A4 TaxID=2933944 RepID=A0ABV0JD12_9CYAN|nr:hypothetical protein [Trichocoleus sp. FACHB-46]MBD1864288.1 hypothetical protein [Trichocoleus sp. FACHB-46]
MPDLYRPPSGIDFAGALSNLYNEGKPGILSTKDGKLKGKILSLHPQIRVTIDGKAGCIILTPQQFQECWEFE